MNGGKSEDGEADVSSLYDSSLCEVVLGKKVRDELIAGNYCIYFS